MEPCQSVVTTQMLKSTVKLTNIFLPSYVHIQCSANCYLVPLIGSFQLLLNCEVFHFTLCHQLGMPLRFWLLIHRRH